MSVGREPLRSECDPQGEEVRRKQARKRKHVEGDMGSASEANAKYAGDPE